MGGHPPLFKWVGEVLLIDVVVEASSDEDGQVIVPV
jgi:hypothetical protein